MSTTTPPRTHCPTCGAKLARQDMSNCPYCSTPFALVEQKAAQAGPSPFQERLQRMEEKEEFQAGLTWTPPEPEDWYRARRRVVAGIFLLGIGLGVLAQGLATGAGWLGRPSFWIGIVAAGLGLLLVLRALQRRKALTRLPLLRRAAIIHDRRSTTEMVGSKGETVYYFTMEFADGSSGEFRFPGRGPSFDLYTIGVTGLAYTRGTELLSFKRIRV
jgi:hypothetical protein